MIRNGSWRTSSLDDIMGLPSKFRKLWDFLDHKYNLYGYFLSGCAPYVFQSRRQRHRQQPWHPLDDKLDTENVVDGVAYLSFPRSGAWFQVVH